MTSDDGSETPDAELLSIGNHAMAAQGLRHTDVRAELGASVAGEVLLLKPEGVGPSLLPSSSTLLTLPSRLSAVGYFRVAYDADGALQARRRRSSPSTLSYSACTRAARRPREKRFWGL